MIPTETASHEVVEGFQSKRTEAQARTDIAAANMAIRNHQIRQQIALEQEAERYERLSLSLTDRTARHEALRLSIEYDARANRIRNAVALTNFLVPESADQEAERLERGRESWHKEACWK